MTEGEKEEEKKERSPEMPLACSYGLRGYYCVYVCLCARDYRSWLASTGGTPAWDGL